MVIWRCLLYRTCGKTLGGLCVRPYIADYSWKKGEMAFGKSFLLGARLKASHVSARAWSGPAGWVYLMKLRCEVGGGLPHERGCDDTPFPYSCFP